MSLYDAAKDAVKLAQKADNIELIQKLLDVQAQALEMQEKLYQSNQKIEELKTNIEELKAKRKYQYEEGHKWIINPDNPSLKLCPVCMNRDNFESPLGDPYNGGYRDCSHCSSEYN